jgi:molecular chaperone IbpA
MTSKDISIFNSLRPFSIGFDDMFDQFETILDNGGVIQNNYPPYNIRKTGKDKYAIELAVAGFNKNDVEIEYEDKFLTVKTKKIDKTVEKEGNEIIHRGISQRSFSRTFTIADDVKVNEAKLKDGLLIVSCEKITPEYKKKKLIPIS